MFYKYKIIIASARFKINLQYSFTRTEVPIPDLSGKKKQLQFSMEKQIPADMPPCYIVVCMDDPVVDYRNSFVLYDAMQEKNIQSRLAVYEWGGHGFGMLNNRFMRKFRWNEKMWDDFLAAIIIPMQ